MQMKYLCCWHRPPTSTQRWSQWHAMGGRACSSYAALGVNGDASMWSWDIHYMSVWDILACHFHYDAFYDWKLMFAFTNNNYGIGTVIHFTHLTIWALSHIYIHPRVLCEQRQYQHDDPVKYTMGSKCFATRHQSHECNPLSEMGTNSRLGAVCGQTLRDAYWLPIH